MQAAIDAIKARHDPATNPYFQALEAGRFAREDFVETQIQFLFAVVFFSRPMAVLLGRLPLPSMRLGLLENVRDEHGGGKLSQAHEATFLALLGRLGVSPEEVDRRALWPELRAFNTTLAGAALLDDVPTAMAMLGIIEDLFSGISATLGRGIVARGWLRPEDLVHYRLHEELDQKHAQDFYDVVAPTWRSGPRGRYQVEQGLELGASIFLRLYEDLHRHRGRRRFREVGGPHSLADGWVPGSLG